MNGFRFMRRLLLAALAITAVACASSDDRAVTTTDQALEADAEPPAFAAVKDGLYRGGHPDRAGLEYLQKLGVGKILSLQQPDGSIIEGDRAAEVAAEQADAAALGLEYVSIPMTSWASASAYDDAWSQIKPLLDRPAGLYVHCEHGKDRTGLVIALERVVLEGWSPEQAHDEMLAHGHSRFLVKLDAYFWSATGGAER
jgi:tyrosine-protein phosphatase SIW14